MQTSYFELFNAILLRKNSKRSVDNEFWGETYCRKCQVLSCNELNVSSLKRIVGKEDRRKYIG